MNYSLLVKRKNKRDTVNFFRPACLMGGILCLWLFSIIKVSAHSFSTAVVDLEDLHIVPFELQTICQDDNFAPINFTAYVDENSYDITTGNLRFEWKFISGTNVTGFSTTLGFVERTSGTSAEWNPNNPANKVTGSGEYEVTPVWDGKRGQSFGFTLIRIKKPVIKNNNVVLCNGDPLKVNFLSDLPGTEYIWKVKTGSSRLGIPLEGTGNMDISMLRHSATSPIRETIQVTPYQPGSECSGDVMEFDVIVRPTSTVNNINDIILEKGEFSPSIEFTGNATLFEWTSSNPAIGMSASGTLLATSGRAFMPPFKALNTGENPIQSTITVTPVYSSDGGSCSGTPIKFNIVVISKPALNAISDKTACDGESVVSFTPSGLPSGDDYYITWSGGADIGLPDENGSNKLRSIALFYARAINNTPTDRKITVTPHLLVNGQSISGTSRQFTVSVYPVPAVNNINDIILESGSYSTGEIEFTGNANLFEWTSSNPAIGTNVSGSVQAANGRYFMQSFRAENSGSTPLTSKITVTPVYSANGHRCVGRPTEFNIVVVSKPALGAISDREACNGESVSFTPPGLPSGNNYYITWSGGEDIGLPDENGSNRCRSIVFSAKMAVNALTVREITVTPWLSVNEEVKAGTPVRFTFSVYPDIELGQYAADRPQVVIERCLGENIRDVLKVNATGANLTYQWYKDRVLIDGATESTYNIDNVDANMTGTYYVLVGNNCNNSQQSKNYEVRIKLPIIEQRWGNILILITNSNDNGGYAFSNIQWYRMDQGNNPVEIPGANLTYLYSDTPVDGITYVVKATMQDGTIYESCPVTGIAYDPVEIQVYPNPVKMGETITLDANLPENDWENTFIQLLSLDGRIMKSLKALEQKTSIVTPTIQGVYILRLTTGSGDVYEYKVMVK
jgi:hypothetical protein